MKRVFSICLLLIYSIFFIGMINGTKSVNAYSQDANGNWYWGYESKLNESYYQSLNNITDASEFEDALHKVISTGVKVGSYNDAKTSLKTLDEDPNNTNNILCMYTGKSMPKSASGTGGTTTWNREHTWAKSHGFSNSSYAAYSDILHLRATECQTNSTRGNLDFGEVTSGKSDEYGNKWNSNYFEPRDCVKGDIARIMMYMDVRYDGDSLSGGLKLTLVNGTTSTSSGNGYFGDLSTLLKWHVEDPVDDLERRRNDRAYQIQGNRNPFIDHPEYANIVYDTNYEVDDGYKVSFNIPDGVAFNYTDSTLYETGDLIKEPTVVPVHQNGYEFLGWYKDATYTQLWDFANDTVSGNVTLYACFNSDEAVDVIFAKIRTLTALAFDYEASESDGSFSDTVEVNTFSGTGSIDGNVGDVLDLADYVDFDSSLFTMELHYNGKANFYIKPGEMRLYNAGGNGTFIVIKAVDDVRITDITVSSSTDDLEVTYADDYSYAEIKNISSSSSGNTKVYSFSITYESGEKTTYSLGEIVFKYRYEISCDLYNQIKTLDQNAKFGITVNGVEYDLLPRTAKDADGNSYYYVEKHFVLTDEIGLSDEIDACGFIEVNNQTITNIATNYSVNTIAKAYLATGDLYDVVVEHKEVLKYLTTVRK